MPGNVKPSSFTAGQRVPTSLSALGALVREADGSGASLAGITDVQPGTVLASKPGYSMAFLGNDAYTTTAVTSQLVGAAVQGDVLVTHAHIVHGGRRMIVASAEVYRQRPGADDRLVALVTCQQLVLEPS